MENASSPKSPLRVAYLCDADPRDRNLYSGGNARLFDALSTRFENIHILSQGWGWAEPVRRLVLALPEPIILRAKWRLHLLLSSVIARAVRKELEQQQFDVLFCAYSFHSLYGLKPSYPITTVFTSDATPSVYKHSEIGQAFDSFFSLSRKFDHLIVKAETQVFQSTDLLLWPSNWIKNDAEKWFELTPGHSQVVPWGANFPDPGILSDAPQLVAGNPVRILLVGRDWFAKGGPITAETVQLLRDQGVDARLTVVGCTPPETGLGDALRVYPSLDKSKPDEMKLFQDLYRRAHFMMMPSFESYGFAFCEASAYGLPSLCADVGGVPVYDGINGFALPTDTGPGAYAEIVQEFLAAPERYDALRQSTRREYEERLNWDAWADRTAALIEAAVAARNAS
ncbi:glycosyltransferase family 4 protein [Thalassovita sp.]|uniref:glycosyltransferase family 4 protein n=1 Tax=Thalassovita sp. TaxID=1979401 RepID=UPI002B273065|nr:glycosyltransferase family 4 protein [Thalassovita sp.]